MTSRGNLSVMWGKKGTKDLLRNQCNAQRYITNCLKCNRNSMRNKKFINHGTKKIHSQKNKPARHATHITFKTVT